MNRPPFPIGPRTPGEIHAEALSSALQVGEAMGLSREEILARLFPAEGVES